MKSFFNTGNFTQSVWKGSKEVGIGYATNQDKNQNFVVATFLPKGNLNGGHPTNVLPRKINQILVCFPNRILTM
jgi:hypothetical protein